MKIGLREKGQASACFPRTDDMEKAEEFELVDKAPQTVLRPFSDGGDSAFRLAKEGDNHIRLTMIDTVEDDGICFHGAGGLAISKDIRELPK